MSRFLISNCLIGAMAAVVAIAGCSEASRSTAKKPAAEVHSDDDGHDHGKTKTKASDAEHGHAHGGDKHEHKKKAKPDDHEHDEATSLCMSKQARANIGVKVKRVKLGPFARSLAVPATVVRRPGRSQVQVAAPFTGRVKRIHRVEGEAVTSGMPLFDLQLTHEELVQTQAEFLRVAEELDVVKREVERLTKVAANGAIAGKTLLARQYEQQKLEGVLKAQTQSLLLHGLSGEQVEQILEDRELLQDLTVTVPEPSQASDQGELRLLQVERLNVEVGQHITIGDPLCMLADYNELHIRGEAFEQDIPSLTQAAKNGWPVTAVFERPGADRQIVEDLKILYLDNEVEALSRAFHFYVLLPNRLARDSQNGSGHRFIDWEFRPGQRLRLRVPTEPSEDRIVLPVEAVVREGAEAFVFELNGDHFDRRGVQIEHRDQDYAVIANDGALKPGVKVAVAGAYQIYLGTKNKGGQDVTAHAGHSH